MIGLRYFLLLIRIHIVAILVLITIDITSSQVKPTMPWLLNILHGSIIGLWWLFLLIRIHIVAILGPILVDITGAQAKPLELSCGPLSPAGGWDGIVLVAFVTFIFVILAAPWHPELKGPLHAIVVQQDVWVSASDLWMLKRLIGRPIIKMNSTVNTCRFHADDHRRWRVLRRLDYTLDCT
jgi:hypothetical protein